MDFVRFRLEKRFLKSQLEIHAAHRFQGPRQYAMIYCVDVLEHLLNPSDIFLNKIDPLLIRGGLLYIKAPWRGQLTHLDEAPENFYRWGGRKQLSRKYTTIMRAHPMDMATVFRKVSDPSGGR